MKTVKDIILDWEQYKISGEDINAVKKDTTSTEYYATNIWVGKQDEYDAIEAKDTTTLYHIVDDA